MQTEIKEKCIVNWLETLPLHSYDVREEYTEPASLKNLREKYNTTQT